MKLSQLFERCLHTRYTHVQNSADFALRRNGATLFIYFAHSDGRTDWKNNLNFPARAYKRERQPIWYAHRGFLKLWQTIEDYIAADVTDHSVKKVIVVGYSHGAALAFLCHEYIWHQRPDLRDRIEGYGFGCPRVFFGIPSAKLRERWASFTVVRNLDDIVTHLPPKLFGYTHIGKMLEIGQRGKYSSIDAHRAENIMAELIECEKR